MHGSLGVCPGLNVAVAGPSHSDTDSGAVHGSLGVCPSPAVRTVMSSIPPSASHDRGIAVSKHRHSPICSLTSGEFLRCLRYQHWPRSAWSSLIMTHKHNEHSSFNTDLKLTCSSVGTCPVTNSQKRPSGSGSSPPGALGSNCWHSGML